MTIKTLILSTTGGTTPWGVSAVLQFPGDKKSLMNIHTAKLNVSVNMVGAPANTPITIVKPLAAWITNYIVNIEYYINGKSKTVQYNSMVNRGDIAYLYSIMDRSANNTNQELIAENINAQQINGPLWSGDLPLQYLLDFAEEDRWLPIKSMNFQLFFDSVANIFYSAGSTSAFIPQIVEYSMLLQSCEPNSLVLPMMMYPSKVKTKSYNYQWPVGNISNPISIATEGKVTEVFYFFFSTTTNTPATVGSYNLNPNPFSVVTYHQINLPSGSYPQTGQYNASYTGGANNFNTNKLYYEFLSGINKYRPSHNTMISQQVWLNAIRPYVILMDNPRSVDIGTVILNIQLSQAPTNPMNIIVFVRSVPSD